jgi:hypothetical protein
VEQYFDTDVSGYAASPDQQDIPKRRHKTAVQHCVTAQNNEDFIHFTAEA